MRTMFSVVLSVAAIFSAGAQSGDSNIIRIATDNTDLVLEIGPNKRVYQTYLGPKLMFESDMQNLSWSQHAGSDGSGSTRGGKYIRLPAMRISSSRLSELLTQTAT